MAIEKNDLAQLALEMLKNAGERYQDGNLEWAKTSIEFANAYNFQRIADALETIATAETNFEITASGPDPLIR